MTESPQSPEAWRALCERLVKTRDEEATDSTHIVYLLGETDAGKTTLCNHLVRTLTAHAGETGVAQLDCDPGQSSIGPPTTLGLTLHGVASPPPTFLRFVGATTPRGHLLPMLVGARRLADRAMTHASRWLIVDSPGLVVGDTGREFQHQMIELLNPHWLVVLGEAAELLAITQVFQSRGMPRVHQLPLATAVTRRTPNQRARYRDARFQAYFAHARHAELNLGERGVHGRVPAHPEEANGCVVALCNQVGEMVVLGVVQSFDQPKQCLRVLAPPFEASEVKSVQFGGYQLDLTGAETASS